MSTRTEAQEDAPISAEEQYDQGIEAFRSGDLERACLLFGASYTQEPLPGVLFTWATCEARQGKLASSAEHFESFINMVGELPAEKQAAQEARVRAAEEELTQLKPDIPALVIELAAGTPSDAVVRLNGEQLDNTKLASERFLDPGTYSITLETERGVVEKRRITLTSGEEVLVQLGRAEVSEPEPAPADLGPRGVRRMSPWFYVAAGTGGAGLLAGSLTGLIAIRAKGCESGECGSASEVRAAENAQTIAHVSTASFIVGAIGSAAAVAIYFKSGSPKAEHAAAKDGKLALRLNGSSVSLGGTF